MYVSHQPVKIFLGALIFFDCLIKIKEKSYLDE